MADDRDAQQREELQRKAAEELAQTKKLVAKIAWTVVGILVAATVVFWFGWVRAPSPEQICQHKIELAKAAGAEQSEGTEALISQLELKCVEAARNKILMRGKLVYAEYAKCVMAATSLDEAERC
ncbi:MAG: hypothetical protein R6X02_25110 [Enhygromyxa sp.]